MGKYTNAALDKIDKNLAKKYADITTVLKENYQNKKRKNTKKYYKKDTSVCNDNYLKSKDINNSISKMHKQTEEYINLKKHPLLNSKKIKELEEELKKYSNPNYCYEYYGMDIIRLTIGKDFVKIFANKMEAKFLPEFTQLRIKLVNNLGYCIPTVRVMDSQSLAPKGYKIEIRGRKVFEDVLTSDNITEEDIQTIMDNLEKMCIKYVRKIITKKDVLMLMELVNSDNPTLVNDLIPIFLSPIDLKHIFANLIEQKISIKDILYVFEILNDYARYTNDIDVLTEKVKQELLFS